MADQNTNVNQPKAEPNAQNSELDPQAHPSGARIEKMMKSEHYVSPEEPAEGSRDDVDEDRGDSLEAPHRMDADNRENRG